MVEPVDLSLLVHLDALLQEVSVTRAAQRVGLSTPAMSHSLARMRDKLGDELLVRAGRGMVLTPRAEAMKPRVHAAVADARRALEPERPFSPRELDRSFVVLATDYVLTVLGVAVDRILRDEAPRVAMRFVPNAADDPALLRDGGADLSIGIYGDLPQEMRKRQLLSDRFVVVVRDAHPVVGKRLSLEQFTRLPHVQIAPRGKPGGYVDDVLADKGLSRHVARAIPYFLPALYVTSQTDYLLTVSARVAEQMAPSLGLRVLEPPVALRPYALSLVWHPRFDGDPGHKFLRDVFTRAAREVAAETHEGARTRLEPGSPNSGQARKRKRKQHG